MAQSGHPVLHRTCPLLGVKRTLYRLPQDRLLCPREIHGSDKYRVDRPAHGITLCGEVIAVTITLIDRDPVVCYRLIDPALEIAVAYLVKIIALKDAVRRYPVAYKDVENLAADFIIGRSVKHELAPAFGTFNDNRP